MRIVHPRAGRLEFKALRKFILDGKRAGWASGTKPAKLSDGTKHYELRQDNLVYTDDFIGEQNFIGRELVTLRGIPIWGMNYSDAFMVPKVFTENFPRKEIDCFRDSVLTFVKEMLRNPPSNFPFRGPTIKTEKTTPWGNLSYINQVFSPYFNEPNKVVREFAGTERVDYFGPLSLATDMNICFALKYHGRILVPDSCIF